MKFHETNFILWLHLRYPLVHFVKFLNFSLNLFWIYPNIATAKYIASKRFEFIDGLSLPSICIFLPKEILESKCVLYFRSLKIQLSGIFIVASQQIFCNLDWALLWVMSRKKDQLIKQKITNPKRIICSKFYINRKGSKSLELLSLKSFLLFPKLLSKLSHLMEWYFS